MSLISGFSAVCVDPSFNRQLALKRLGRSLEAWLVGTLRGILLTWRRSACTQANRFLDLQNWAKKMEKDSIEAKEAMKKINFDLREMTHERDALLSEKEARLKAEKALREALMRIAELEGRSREEEETRLLKEQTAKALADRESSKHYTVVDDNFEGSFFKKRIPGWTPDEGHHTDLWEEGLPGR